MDFSKILLKFAIVFKIFDSFCPILSLTIIKPWLAIDKTNRSPLVWDQFVQV